MLTPEQAKALKVGDKVLLRRRFWSTRTIVKVTAKSAMIEDGRISLETGRLIGADFTVWLMGCPEYWADLQQDWRTNSAKRLLCIISGDSRHTTLTVDQLQAIAKILGVDIGQPPKEPDNG